MKLIILIKPIQFDLKQQQQPQQQIIRPTDSVYNNYKFIILYCYYFRPNISTLVTILDV